MDDKKPSLKWPVIAFAVLSVIVAVGASAWVLTQRGPANTTASLPDVAEVIINDEGFSPAELRIKVGTTVTWVNRGEKPHQVASEPHPTHDGLAGFDSLQGVEKDGSYSYTFRKEGRFPYHDHLHPFTALVGTIVVDQD
jgi:plastocyanin